MSEGEGGVDAATQAPLTTGTAPGGAVASGVRRPLGWRWVATVVVSAGVGAAVAMGLGGGGPGPGVTVVESGGPPGPALAGPTSVPALVRRVLPAVVSVVTRSGNRQVQGSGMIVSANGTVVTNDHVVALAAGGRGTITVTRAGTTVARPAHLVGAAAVDDVAVLQLSGVTGLPTVTLGDSDRLVVGDAVVAMGNALGLSTGTPSVTAGIVSALGRTVTATGAGTGPETLSDVIQTDAAIDAGSSGGPLVDSAGQVVGMNTAVAGTVNGSGVSNIGFAIPSATIEALVPALVKGSALRGSSLGVVTETLTPALRAHRHVVPRAGAVVLGVLSGSPSARAGLRPGDVVVRLDAKRITSAPELDKVLRRKVPGQAVAVTFFRGARRHTVSVTLAATQQ